jgi:hypothetical protein
MGFPKENPCAFSVYSVALWLAYVIT